MIITSMPLLHAPNVFGIMIKGEPGGWEHSVVIINVTLIKCACGLEYSWLNVLYKIIVLMSNIFWEPLITIWFLVVIAYVETTLRLPINWYK